MENIAQQFLKELDDKLWKSADKLRSSMDAANYKHVVLGLIFLKYVSDAFEERQQELIQLFQDESESNIYHLPRDDYDSEDEYNAAIQSELELADYYKEQNVVWVPQHARWKYIETAQVIEELIQMAKDFQADIAREESLGLSPDEVAFYDALANNESATRELGDEILKKIAIEITEKLRKSTTVDWQVRESVRAQLRILVRRTLQKYKYPPDQAADAVELVLKQAEALSGAWSQG